MQPTNSKPLGDMALLERGKFSPRPRNDPQYYNGVYPFVQTGDVANCNHRLVSYHQTLNEKGIKVSKCFSPGTILIALVGATIGATAILEIDAYAPDSLIGITPKPNVCNNVFLEVLLQFWQPELKRIAPEAARANINLGILENVPIIDADFSMQEDFAAFVRDIDKSKYEHENSRLFPLFITIFMISYIILRDISVYSFSNETKINLEGVSMPALSMFFGIIVRMQSEKGGKHNKPHIHALYGDDEIVVGLDGEVLEGSFPNKQLKLLLAWIVIHEDELKANWELLSNGEGYFKIAPLS